MQFMELFHNIQLVTVRRDPHVSRLDQERD